MILSKELSFIDLFAGAGGLSEGFIRAGFTPIAHVEMNPYACQTLETRAAYHYLKSQGQDALQSYYDYERGLISREQLFEQVPQEERESVINKEMSSKTAKSIYHKIDHLMEHKGIKHVSVIIGGPPCQAYSLVGRAQTNHMLRPMEEDPRNELYKQYVNFLKRYEPEMFVFENVQGITSARNGEAFADLQRELNRIHYTFECHVQNAQTFGVMQNRKRMIIIGWRQGTEHFYPDFQPHEIHSVVQDLLFDLPPVERGGQAFEYAVPYQASSEYVRVNGLRTEEDVLTLHKARINNERDVEIYNRAIHAWFDNHAHQRLHYNELPEDLKTHHNQTSFVDRFKVVEADTNACHTVLAHLAKDGHYFIHPDVNQCRSITVREAARLQTFPDNYYFEGNRSAQFTQIGNAVPPMMAQGIAQEIRQQLCGEQHVIAAGIINMEGNEENPVNIFIGAVI